MTKFINLFIAIILLIGAFILLNYHKRKQNPSFEAEQTIQTGFSRALHGDSVAIELVNDIPYILVSVNGRAALPFILATSYVNCIYDKELAQLQDLQYLSEVDSQQTQADFVHQKPRAILKSVKIGTAEVQNIPVELNDLDWTQKYLGQYAAGFIGYEFLKHFEVTLDFPAQMLRLASTDSVPYPTVQSDSLTVLPLLDLPNYNQHVFMNAIVNHKAIILALDTMSRDGLLLEGTPDRYKPGVTFGGFEESTRYGRAHSIQRGTIAHLHLGAVRVDNIPTQFSCIVEPTADLPYSNVLGMGALKSLKLVLNYQKRQIIIEKG